MFVLIVAAAAFILYLHYSGDISAYESASSCASPGDALQGQACVYKGQAKVLSTSRHDRLEAAVEFGFFFLFMYLGNSSDLAAYSSASTCASINDAVTGRACRDEGQARVLGTSRPVRLQVQVAFDSLPGRNFTASFVVSNEPDSAALKAGGTVAAELWNGKVTRLAGKTSDADPVLDTTTPFLITAAILGVWGVLVIFLGGWLARAAWRRS